MALPLIGFFALIGIAFLVFAIGVSRTNMNTNFALITFAAVILIVCGLFVMNEGIQLDSVASVDPSTGVVTYQVVTYDNNTWDWVKVIADILLYGGFVIMIFGFAFNFFGAKNRRVNEFDIG